MDGIDFIEFIEKYCLINDDRDCTVDPYDPECNYND